jgi:small GTP-binding protein
MSKARVALLLFLFLFPWLALIGLGGIYMYEHRSDEWWAGEVSIRWVRWIWIPMFLSVLLSYVLAWWWTRRGSSMLPRTDTPPPNYWTDRDKLAWEKVLDKAKSYERVTIDHLADPKHYTDLALDLATQVAEVYNPGGVSGPGQAFDLLTLPEVMTCVELAAADLNDLVQRYVPGSHVLRIKDVKRARQATELYKVGQNVYWAGSALINPIDTAMRFFASRSVLGGLFDRLQNNVLLWFHTAFVHQLGHYLVELNSGRLKVGVKRYRELLTQSQEPPAETAPVGELADDKALPALPALPPGPAGPAGPKPISIAVLGAVKAGKSSLVNALLGKQQATVDALPVQHVGMRYNVTLPGGQAATILDTAGYGQDGPNEAELAAAAQAAQEADLILLVTAANNPGRKPDVDLLDGLKFYFAERPNLKMSPVVVVVNQVDLLSPKSEWSPPYNWQSGTRPKEANIRECMAAVREQIGNRAVGVVPVCARTGETFGITETLVPEIALNLDDARGSAVLRAFDAEGAADQFKRLGRQLVEGGKQAWNILLQNLKK